VIEDPASKMLRCEDNDDEDQDKDGKGVVGVWCVWVLLMMMRIWWSDYRATRRPKLHRTQMYILIIVF